LSASKHGSDCFGVETILFAWERDLNQVDAWGYNDEFFYSLASRPAKNQIFGLILQCSLSKKADIGNVV
jgi:hypothetical protein